MNMDIGNLAASMLSASIGTRTIELGNLKWLDRNIEQFPDEVQGAIDGLHEVIKEGKIDVIRRA